MSQVTKHFNVITDNMACPCCNAFVPDMTFLNRVEILRQLLEVPFYLDKAGGGFYRCRDYQLLNHPEYPNSQHTLGKAMDISTLGWSGNLKWQFVKWAQDFGLSIIIYDRWFHVDLRDGAPAVSYGK